MKEIVPDAHMLQSLLRSNVYLLVSSKGLSLVDSGMPGGANAIASELEQGGFSLSDLRTIVLTHAHPDHAGSAAELARRSGAHIWAHEAAVPFIEQTQPLPSASPLQRVMMWLADRLLSLAGTCNVNRALREGDMIDTLGGLQVLHTPGHTPGSMCLYHPQRRILFCGDLLFNMNPLTGQPGLRLPMPFISLDVGQVRESVHKVAALPVEVLCFGHGEPILQGAQRRLQALLEE